MRVALDTNILAYAEGVQRNSGDAPKIEISRRLLTNLLSDLDWSAVAPIQALLELQHVLTRKAGRSSEAARAAVRRLADVLELAPTTSEILTSAMDLSAAHQMQIFDAVILTAAASAKCELLLSEDLQEGFRHGGVTVANPFASALSPALQSLLRS